MAALLGMSGAVALAATAIAGVATVNRFADSLRDYDTSAAGAFDHATARFQLVDTTGGTTAVLHVRGVDAPAGTVFGAHLHDGACAQDAPSLALGHYNRDAHAGTTPVTVSDASELWLDFTVDATGAGDSSTTVRFPVAAGHHSVVIHANPTNQATGTAGPRLACLPVEW